MSPAQEVDRYLKFIGVVRVAYGIAAVAAPKVCATFVGTRADDEVRYVNTFLGSRDIAVGLHALMAGTPARRRDAVLLNWACEVGDTVVWGSELARGRRSKQLLGLIIPFNLAQHAQWARAMSILED